MLKHSLQNPEAVKGYLKYISSIYPREVHLKKEVCIVHMCRNIKYKNGLIYPLLLPQWTVSMVLAEGKEWRELSTESKEKHGVGGK